jgi:HAD superfamily hydrolase (TIGR01662 family)
LAEPPRRAVFLDRDGTLVEDPGYLHDPAAVRLLPGVAQGLTDLDAAGLALVLVSNQSGIARGFFPPEARRPSCSPSTRRRRVAAWSSRVAN